MKRISAIWLAVLLFLIPCALADAGFSSDPDAMEAAAKSVLMLEVYDDDGSMIATGSGFIAFNGYTLVTNCHVLEDANYVLANSDDGDQYVIRYLQAADEEKDIAICEFEQDTGLEPLELNEEQDLKRGMPVVAIGSPNGITNSVSTGIISALYEEDGVSMIQFTAPISEGSSGGVLLDDEGQVIGVTSATYRDTQNMNLAVNISEVIALYESNSDSVPVESDSDTVQTDDDLLRFFPGIEAATTAEEAVNVLNEYGIEEIEIETDDGTDYEVYFNVEDYAFYDEAVLLDYGYVTYYGTDGTLDEVIFLQDESRSGFANARNAMVEVYGTPDFGMIELYEDYEAWTNSQQGHHEIRHLSKDEMVNGSATSMLNDCRLTDCDFDMVIYWGNLHLFYGVNGDQTYLWLSSQPHTYANVASYFAEVYE